MTVRNLDSLLKPTSIALVGASRQPKSIGAVVARNLFNAGFDGPVMPVNPHERSIEGVLCYPTVESLPITPDLAVICTPPDTVPDLVRRLGERGTKAAIIITAGFGELGPEGKALQQRVLDAARPHLMRIAGPNCLGVMVPGRGINASFAHVNPIRGDIALIAQSGAVVTSIADWATSRNVGFSHLISLGGMADVDFGDLLDYMAADHNTRAICLYVEAITHARKFMSAARAAARQKPVIVIRSGRTDEAAKAASSHTGALAGHDDVYDAAFRRAGMLRVVELDELFDAVETLAMGVQITGDRLAIVTNGGGIGVMATDTLIEEGGCLAGIDEAVMAKLDAVLPPTWSRGNPIDIIGDASGKRYADTLSALVGDRNHDAVLVINCPVAVADGAESARAVIESLKGRKHPVLTSWLGDSSAQEARHLFASSRIPTYETPSKAVRAFMHLVRYRKNQELLMETPASTPEQFQVDEKAARAVIDAAIADGRGWLSEFEAKHVLEAYGIPVVETLKAGTPDEAAEAARRIGKPVALKILSVDIIHKSDIGGVQLHIKTPEEVRAKAVAMLERVRALRPDAVIEGFTVQAMASKPGAHELIVGVADDPLFGPVLLFGQGGTSVEVVQDKALGLPPLNTNLAREMMSRTRVWKLLQGYRDRPPAANDQVALTLIKVSQLVTDIAEIVELDINPLLADDTGVLALDARIKVAVPALVPGSRRLAIRPYPKKLEKRVKLNDGREFLLRPIRPEDEPIIHRMFERMTPEDIRLRFFAPMKRLSHQMAAKLTQIDYDREMALVAVAQMADGQDELYGIVRIAADPDNQKAEYAVMVRSDMKGKGLGYVLMTQIIEYARSRGIGEVFGEVLRENTTMLAMCHELGFTRRENRDEPGVVEVRISLAEPAGKT
ncbi:bifunctional acetate--CoA ligase family protein/GNAT family N-acetyltransferase [Skermanella sp. TT6]|uniref:Bifunctional acetate--CoA ligase family protein/GNAT family N-acetyltransferase n=1 Tax=Skermanella cutis TaxID=2775420 RepID=A0ABX7B5Z4_9PROT|nr:bifunctional acetate--CoA ligase family protein/GNAT family N-acetyltransferase [Skermanella sp. TT6]QQP89737.1 bifunctional acetate--CoA ligase family protein/GNAT family N-acetyltransferase [Skermanella sp. TT6]